MFHRDPCRRTSVSGTGRRWWGDESVPEDNSGRWLRRMREFIRVQEVRSEVGPLVREPAVFEPQRYVREQVVVGASAVDESRLGLRFRSEHEASLISGRSGNANQGGFRLR